MIETLKILALLALFVFAGLGIEEWRGRDRRDRR
jgi:hypothetical protein